MFGNSRKKEATLYYLYMMADGEVSHKEERIFHTICNELDLTEADQNSIIETCKELTAGTDPIFRVMVREKMDEQMCEGWFGLKGVSGLARIVWNLVNLGFADSEFSREEKEIVHYLVDKWSIDLEVYQEFLDTADTMLALTKQKEWLLSTFEKDSTRDKREKDVDDKIMQLLKDVKLTIKELTM